MSSITWDHSLLKLVNISYDLVASSIEGGRALNGLTGAIDFSGGGLWRMSASVELYQPEEHRAWFKMASILNGGVNSINMPFRTDRINMDTTVLAFESDLVGDFSVGASTIYIRVQGPSDGLLMQEGMIFGLNHSSGGLRQRVYLVKHIISATVHPTLDYTIYNVAIRPTLRADASNDDPVDWSRPACRMRLPSGATMRWDVTAEQFWLAQNSIELIEALPVEDPPYDEVVAVYAAPST
jgi:hypothetical protein